MKLSSASDTQFYLGRIIIINTLLLPPPPPKFVSFLNVGDQRRTSHFPSVYFVFLCEFDHCFTLDL
jgi:hypothetical protein